MLTKVPITMQLKPQKMININIRGVLQMCLEKILSHKFLKCPQWKKKVAKKTYNRVNQLCQNSQIKWPTKSQRNL